MNFLNLLKWEKSIGNSLVSKRETAPCDMLVTPKSPSLEYNVLYNGVSGESLEFLSNEGYIIPKNSSFSLEVKFTDSDKTPAVSDLEEFGFSVEPYEARQHVDVWDAPLGAFSITPYLCGLKTAKTIKENMKAISPFGEYGHQSMTVLKNGKGYTVYTANNVTMKEYDENTFSRLAVYDINEPEKARFYTVAQKGVNGNINIDGVSSLVSIVDGGENLVTNCYGFVDGVITEFRRIFDVKNECFGELEACKLVKDGESYPFTNESVAMLFGAEYGLTKIKIEMGVGPYFQYNGEWYTWLYTGSGRFAGIFLKTSDFLSFEFVMIPKEARGTKCEIISTLFGDFMYVAFRRDYEMQRLEVVKYDIKTLKPVDSIVLKDTAMRPYFYEYGGELYLVHSPHSRHYTSLVKLSTVRRLKMSHSILSIENLHLCTPCPVVYNGEIYLTFSARHGSYSQIFISHFPAEIPYSEEKINNAFLNILESETE